MIKILLFHQARFTRNFLNEKNINFLKGLQRKYTDIKINFLKGEGYKDKMKCNNDTDFFTYDSISDIDKKYFFLTKIMEISFGFLI